MPLTIQDIHIFLHNNLPEYQRRDVERVLRFSLEQLKINTNKNPIKTVLGNWNKFKYFIAIQWQGNEIDHSRIAKQIKPKSNHVKPHHGSCNCGGHYIVRTNPRDGEQFLGCSEYPKCRNTIPL